jgi:hypothetical protein
MQSRSHSTMNNATNAVSATLKSVYKSGHGMCMPEKDKIKDPSPFIRYELAATGMV